MIKQKEKKCIFWCLTKALTRALKVLQVALGCANVLLVGMALPFFQHLDMNVIQSSLLSGGGSSNLEAVSAKIGLVQFELAQESSRKVLKSCLVHP